MKKKIRKKLCVIIFAAMLFSLALNYFVQIRQAQGAMKAASRDMFWQINQILLQNEREVEQIKADYANNCLINAKAVAYIVQNQPEIIGDQAEINKIVKLFQVDEFHIFDENGTLYAGSEPKYFGLNFRSGEQMQFFLPMLEDKSLKLCQEITPNTAEQKYMQYAAVWKEDGRDIVQIGMKPERVLEAMRRNELSYIFSLVTADHGSVICAVDPETYQVLGSTRQDHIGRNISELGISADQIRHGENGFQAAFDQKESYCIFTPSGSVILGRIRPLDSLYSNVNRSSIMLAVYLLLLSVVMIVVISGYLDRYIVRAISSVNQKLRVITGGNLETRVDVETTPEFAELSRQINQMIDSLLDTPNKLAMVLDAVSFPVAVYEIRPNMKRVMTTSRIGDILGLTPEQTGEMMADRDLFERSLRELKRRPLDAHKEVYQVPGQLRYVKMESFLYEQGLVGILMDVTDEVLEKQRIERERDIDLLTGLYSRRAFQRKMDGLFARREELGYAAVLLADADGLKQINDRYGHENGDRYLCRLADILRACPAKNQVAARLGGDEFVLMVYGYEERAALLKDLETVYKAKEDCRVTLSNQMQVPVNFSVGCGFFPDEGEDYRTLVKLADERMYRDKSDHKQITKR